MHEHQDGLINHLLGNIISHPFNSNKIIIMTGICVGPVLDVITYIRIILEGKGFIFEEADMCYWNNLPGYFMDSLVKT